MWGEVSWVHVSEHKKNEETLASCRETLMYHNDKHAANKVAEEIMLT